MFRCHWSKPRLQSNSVRIRLLLLYFVLILLPLGVLTLRQVHGLTDLDIYRISVRRQYFPVSTARIFQNKILESFILSREKLFSVFYF